MAGATDPKAAPYPYGKGLVEVRIGGFVPNAITAGVVDTYVLPFDCYVRKVVRSYSKEGAAHLDAITLKTVDATALTIVADLDASADIAGVEQTLHADIKNVRLVTGNKIQITADSQGATEIGIIIDTIYLEPTLIAEVHP